MSEVAFTVNIHLSGRNYAPKVELVPPHGSNVSPYYRMHLGEDACAFISPEQLAATRDAITAALKDQEQPAPSNVGQEPILASTADIEEVTGVEF